MSSNKGYELQLQSFHLEERDNGVHHQYPCSLHARSSRNTTKALYNITMFLLKQSKKQLLQMAQYQVK